jgi:hypothetical protein
VAGERLFRTFDAARYKDVLPCLDELHATRALSARAHALLASLLAPAPERALRRGHEVLGRIIRHPVLAPRVFLSPKDISSAIEIVVDRTCFEQDGRWSSTERGASWAVLESSLVVLHDDAWFDEVLSRDRPGVWYAPYPRGEAGFRVIPLDLLSEMVDRLRAMLASDLEALDEGPGMQCVRAELDDLVALADRACGHGRALATTVLL